MGFNINTSNTPQELDPADPEFNSKLMDNARAKAEAASNRKGGFGALSAILAGAESGITTSGLTQARRDIFKARSQAADLKRSLEISALRRKNARELGKLRNRLSSKGQMTGSALDSYLDGVEQLASDEIEKDQIAKRNIQVQKFTSDAIGFPGDRNAMLAFSSGLGKAAGSLISSRSDKNFLEERFN